jgi:phosphoglycolate phosphatase-like HAD superfamily hydrolase
VDGTLIDSNYLHVDAWAQALASMDLPADSWRIHRAIGQDSSRLLASLIGDAADERGEEAKNLHSAFYSERTPRLRAFDRAGDLLTTLADAGVQVVLATSASPGELEHLLRALDSDEALTAVTSAGDVDEAKPEPDLLAVAMAKAKVSAANTAMVGDATWDMQAAARAGVIAVGVLSGGVSAAELREAGASAVYDDVAHVLRELDSSPLARLITDASAAGS